ncbi:TPA: transposase [Legionella pneumophila]|nr:transposase [Legionella pneumophila]HAU1496591.1 transposase [Legionella pneumophila]
MDIDQKYSRDLCSKLYPLFKDGSSVIEVCQALGILRETYYKWKKDYKDFCEAANFAEEAAEAKFAKLARMALLSNGKIKVDTALYCFIMKTRFGYQETEANSTAGGAEIGQPLSINFSVLPAVGEITITNANNVAE